MVKQRRPETSSGRFSHRGSLMTIRPEQGSNAVGPIWLDIARKYIGLKEIKGPKHNSTILRMWVAIKAAWFKDDETPWCAGFVGFVLEEAGIKSTRSAAARSYETFGKKLDRPAVGCIAVKTRKGGGHVGFVLGRDKWGHLMILGGNQDDQVKIAPYNASSFHAFRWPGTAPAAHRYDLPLLTSDGRVSTKEA